MWELYSKDRKAGGDKLQILGRAEAGFKKKKRKKRKQESLVSLNTMVTP